MTTVLDQNAEFEQLKSQLTDFEILQGYRRFHLRRLIAEHGGQTELSKALGYHTSTFLTQMVGPTPIRTITEKTARQYEVKLGLPNLTLDEPVMFGKSDLINENDLKAVDALNVDVNGKRKYAKLEYSKYAEPTKFLVAEAEPAPYTPQTEPAPNPQGMPAVTLMELLTLVQIAGEGLPDEKMFKILKMAVTDFFAKSELDTGYVQSLIELSK